MVSAISFDQSPIALMDNRKIDLALLQFNPDTYHFTIGNEDITNLIRRADKVRIIPNFDVDRENLRVFNEGTGAGSPPIGSTSTLTNFLQQITTDPLAAPIETAGRMIEGAAGAVSRSPYLFAGLAIGGLFAAAYLWRTFTK